MPSASPAGPPGERERVRARVRVYVRVNVRVCVFRQGQPQFPAVGSFLRDAGGMEEEGRSAGLVVRLGASAAELGSAPRREGAPQTSRCGGIAGRRGSSA